MCINNIGHVKKENENSCKISSDLTFLPGQKPMDLNGISMVHGWTFLFLPLPLSFTLSRKKKKNPNLELVCYAFIQMHRNLGALGIVSRVHSSFLLGSAAYLCSLNIKELHSFCCGALLLSFSMGTKKKYVHWMRTLKHMMHLREFKRGAETPPK